MLRKSLILLAFWLLSVSSLAQSTTTNLSISKPQTGQAQPQVTIATGFDHFDTAVAGRLAKSVAGSSDVALSVTEARNAIIECTGALTGNINVIVPSKTKIYLVINSTTGAFTLTVKTAAGTGVAVEQGGKAWLYSDGTNVYTAAPTGGGGGSFSFTIANEGTTGTLANGLAKLAGAPSTAVRTSTSDTGGAVGIVTAGAGTGGTATIQLAGQVNCVFENATTAGNYVILGTTTAGNCRDGGATYPGSGQAIGRVLSTNGSAGTYAILLFPPEIRGGSGGGGGGATTALDNLASVAINTSLLPGTTDTIDLGSATKFFRNGFLASYSDWKRITVPANPAAGSLRLFANNATGKLACLDSAGADCMPNGGGGGTPAGSNTQIQYNNSGAFGGSADLAWNDTSKFLTVSGNAAAIRNQGGQHPGTGSGFVMPFIGGSMSGGPGIWWSSNSYGGTNGLWVSLGLNYQGASSAHSPVKIRKSTGTSSDGAIVFTFAPDDGSIQLAPFGPIGTQTSEIQYFELAANGANYFATKAADNIATTRRMTWPNADPAVGESLRVAAYNSGTGLITTEWGSRQISGTASLNFGATAANTCDTLTLTVTGAADGDVVILGIPQALATADTAQVFWAWVSAADTVSVKRCNLTGSALSDPAAATVRATVVKP